MSTLTVSNVSDGSLSIPTTYVTNGSAKAWVNFDGTGTIAARDSLNLSSLTDNGTGDYTVAFSAAMINGNYVVSASIETENSATYGLSGAPGGGRATTSVEINTPITTGAAFDRGHVNVAIHGDLA